MPKKVLSLNEIALPFLSAITKQKNYIPVLNTVLVDKLEGQLVAIATDLDKVVIAPVENLKPGKLYDIVGKEFCESAMAAKNFPDWKHWYKAKLEHGHATVKRNELARANSAISREESRYTLNAACFDQVGNEVMLCSTDGHRLTVTQLSLGGKVACTTLVASHAVRYALKFLGKDDNVTFNFGEEHSGFEIDGVRIIVKNISGKFPNYQAITRYGGKEQWIVDRAELIAGLKTLLPYVKMASSPIVTVERSEGLLSLTAKSSEHSRTVEIEANIRRIPFAVGNRAVSIVMPMRTDNKSKTTDVVGLNINYLLDCANHMKSDVFVFGIKSNLNQVSIFGALFEDAAAEEEQEEQEDATAA